jgi:hypothetical protein
VIDAAVALLAVNAADVQALCSWTLSRLQLYIVMSGQEQSQSYQGSTTASAWTTWVNEVFAAITG